MIEELSLRGLAVAFGVGRLIGIERDRTILAAPAAAVPLTYS